MIKKVYKVYMIDESGAICNHDHPVFQGDEAFDLGLEQDVQVCPEDDVREFLSEGEVLAALSDYERETPAEKRVEVGSFIILPVFTSSFGTVVTKRKKLGVKTKNQ